MFVDQSDEDLVRQARDGDGDAFLALYERYSGIVYRRVRSRVPSQYAEDVTQEVFIAVVRSLPRFEARSRFSTWLYTIVSRQIADFYRQHRRYADPSNVALDDVEGMLSTPLYKHERSDERALIQQALAQLPEHYQNVILMRFADGLTFAEIARQNGQSLEATKSLFRRAIQAIRNEIGEIEHA